MVLLRDLQEQTNQLEFKVRSPKASNNATSILEKLSNSWSATLEAVGAATRTAAAGAAAVSEKKERFSEIMCAEDRQLVQETLNLDLNADAVTLHTKLNRVLMKPLLTACKTLKRVGESSTYSLKNLNR